GPGGGRLSQALPVQSLARLALGPRRGMDLALPGVRSGTGLPTAPGKRGRGMARRLFDNLLESGIAGQRKKKRAVSLPVSIGIHVAVLSAVILIPILLS